ncbi:MAG: hypothetical protein GWN84_19950 [Gammaproteobacteria bacterium]|nr:hypothetical protein [Gammaproteobacteria bacterium]NIR85095.1 hypothetical protein [Gammaproteobacteria bacterium]NIR92005.1 hypothetical protein [Gammaproteobacteria bacterium]
MPTFAMLCLITAAGGCAGQAARPAVQAVVQAQRFVLVDDSGARRAELESHDTVTSLVFYDERGEIRLLVGIDGRSERALILVNRADATPAVQLGVKPSGEPMLGLAGPEGAPRIILDLRADGPGLRLADDNGVERADLSVGRDGGVWFTLRDGEGNPKTRLPLEGVETLE